MPPPDRWRDTPWSCSGPATWGCPKASATATVDASGLSADEVVRAVTYLTDGGADLAIDAVGAPVTRSQAFRALRPGGTVVAVGLAAVDASVSIPVNELVLQQKRVVGSLYGSANPQVDLPRLLGFYRAGRLPLDELPGPVYPLSDVARAHDDLRAGAVGRAVLEPGRAG